MLFSYHFLKMLEQSVQESSDSSTTTTTTTSTKKVHLSESSNERSGSSNSSSSTTIDDIDEYSEKKDEWSVDDKVPRSIELIMFLFGTVVLFNYNTYVNAIDFFQMKFPDDTQLSTNIARVHNIANAISYYLSIIFIERFSIKIRFYVSIAVEIAIAVFFFVYLNVGNPNLTVIYAFDGLSAVFTAVLDGTVLGLAGLFGGKCTAMASSGLALSGVITAVCRVLSKLMGPGEGWFYFGIALLLYVVSACTFIFFLKMDFVKNKLSNAVVSNDLCHRMKRFATVMKKIWVYWILAFICMAITLTIFPGYLNRTESKHGLSQDWVTTIVTSMFMVGDFLGRIITRWFSFPKKKWIAIPHLLRLSFFVLVCISIEGLAIVDDIWIYFMSLLIGLTGGYYVTLCFNYTASMEELEHGEFELATFLISVGMNLGVFCGSWLTYAMPTG